MRFDKPCWMNVAATLMNMAAVRERVKIPGDEKSSPSRFAIEQHEALSPSRQSQAFPVAKRIPHPVERLIIQIASERLSRTDAS